MSTATIPLTPASRFSEHDFLSSLTSLEFVLVDTCCRIDCVWAALLYAIAQRQKNLRAQRLHDEVLIVIPRSRTSFDNCPEIATAVRRLQQDAEDLFAFLSTHTELLFPKRAAAGEHSLSPVYAFKRRATYINLNLHRFSSNTAAVGEFFAGFDRGAITLSKTAQEVYKSAQKVVTRGSGSRSSSGISKSTNPSTSAPQGQPPKWKGGLCLDFPHERKFAPPVSCVSSLPVALLSFYHGMTVKRYVEYGRVQESKKRLATNFTLFTSMSITSVVLRFLLELHGEELLGKVWAACPLLAEIALVAILQETCDLHHALPNDEYISEYLKNLLPTRVVLVIVDTKRLFTERCHIVFSPAFVQYLLEELGKGQKTKKKDLVSPGDAVHVHSLPQQQQQQQQRQTVVKRSAISQENEGEEGESVAGYGMLDDESTRPSSTLRLPRAWTELRAHETSRVFLDMRMQRMQHELSGHAEKLHEFILRDALDSHTQYLQDHKNAPVLCVCHAPIDPYEEGFRASLVPALRFAARSSDVFVVLWRFHGAKDRDTHLLSRYIHVWFADRGPFVKESRRMRFLQFLCANPRVNGLQVQASDGAGQCFEIQQRTVRANSWRTPELCLDDVTEILRTVVEENDVASGPLAWRAKRST